jgi:serine/threonine protein kinase
VAHGDIKPDNVMFNELLGLTFIDLGHANPLGTKQNDNIGTDIRLTRIYKKIHLIW